MAPKRIYAFRHAQAEHKQVPSSPRSRRPLMSCTSSVDEDYSIPDSPLTQLGRSQASQIPNHPLGARANAVADLVVTSPLKRTLQTTLLGFKEARSRVPTIALPALQECNDHPCDTGSSRQELEKDPELGKEFNFSALPDDWTSKKGFWAPTDEALYERLAWVRRWLRDRPEKNIVVVAHGDALRWLTKGKNDFSPWTNTEGRAFEFVDGDNSRDQDAFLKLVDVDAEAGAQGSGPTSGQVDAGRA